MSAETPRHLTPTERLHEVTMAALERQPAPADSSVSITRNAKGVRQWDIVVRGHDIAACEAQAVAIDARLNALYPYPDAPAVPETPTGK